MKNNEGYYNWIHQLNEAAFESQIFQQQLDEEKAKKKAGGMPGFFSTGPAVPAKRKEEGELPLPAHMASSSRLGDPVVSQPTVVREPSETSAKKLPARPVELPKHEAPKGTRRVRKKVSWTDVEPVSPLPPDPRVRGLHARVAREIGLPSYDAETPEQPEPVTPFTLSRALARGEEAGHAVDQPKVGRKREKLDPGLSPEEIQASVKEWQKLRFTDRPEMPVSAADSDALLRAKFPELPTEKPTHEFAPSNTDTDLDGDVDTDDTIFKNVLELDQDLWGQTNSRADFYRLTSDRTPEQWESAYREYASRKLKTARASKPSGENAPVFKVKPVERLSGVTDFPAQRSLGGPSGSYFGRQMEPTQSEKAVERFNRSSLEDINREMETATASIPASTRVSGGEEKVADPEGIMRGASKGSRLQQIAARLRKPGVKVAITPKEEGEEPSVVSGSAFLDRELAANARLPMDVTRPRDNPQPDVARTATRGKGKNKRTVTLAGSITRADEPGQSPQEIRDLNAAERRAGIKRTQQAADRKKKEASVQESVNSIIGRMLYG